MLSKVSGAPVAEAAADPVPVLAAALQNLTENARKQTDGRWLETVTLNTAPHLREWNVDGCWRWEDWPDRSRVMPEGTPAQDVGIDLVFRRRGGGWIAVQVKSRQLDSSGRGGPVTASELDSFLSAASHQEVWAERWMAVNGDVPLAGQAPGKSAMSGGAAVKVVNVTQAVREQHAVLTAGVVEEPCPHCQNKTGGGGWWKTRRCRPERVCNAKPSKRRSNG